jgi:hypothetical protein
VAWVLPLSIPPAGPHRPTFWVRFAAAAARPAGRGPRPHLESCAPTLPRPTGIVRAGGPGSGSSGVRQFARRPDRQQEDAVGSREIVFNENNCRPRRSRLLATAAPGIAMQGNTAAAGRRGSTEDRQEQPPGSEIAREWSVPRGLCNPGPQALGLKPLASGPFLHSLLLGFRPGTVHPGCLAERVLEGRQPPPIIPRGAVGRVRQGGQILFRENNSPSRRPA